MHTAIANVMFVATAGGRRRHRGHDAAGAADRPARGAGPPRRRSTSPAGASPLPSDARHGRRHRARRGRRGGLRRHAAAGAPGPARAPRRCSASPRSTRWAARTPSRRSPTGRRRSGASTSSAAPATSGARRRSARCRGAWGSTGSTAPATSSSSPTRPPTRGSSPSTCSPRASTGPRPSSPATSDDPALLDAVAEQVAELAADRPTSDPAGIVLADAPSMNAALAFAEAFAPEHLELVGPARRAPGARACAPPARLRGPRGATAFGDYVAGSNHCLPTNGAARFASGLSPRVFRRRVSQVHLDDAVEPLAVAGAALARAEGLPVHAESMEARRAVVENSRRDPRRRHHPHHRGDRHPPRARARRHGRRDPDHRRRVLRPHARPARPPRAAGSRRRRARRPRHRLAPHRRGHRARARPGAHRGARRPQGDHPLRPRRRPDGRGAGVVRAGHLGPPAARVGGRRDPARRDRRASSTSSPRSSCAPSPAPRG